MSTVTIWGTDPLTIDQQDKLLVFIDEIGRDRIYTDTTANTITTTTTTKPTTTNGCEKVLILKVY